MSNHDRVSKSDDYIEIGPSNTSAGQGGAAASLTITSEELGATVDALTELHWEHGLTRNQIRREYSAFPLSIYLRLPDSKRFTSPQEILREAGIAASRAEGDFLGAHPDIPSDDSVDDGGPPGWGDQSGVYASGTSVEGGSAEDKEGLLPGDEPGQEPTSD